MCNKKEFKVGEVFQFGFKKLRCVENPKRCFCDMCYFIDESNCDEGEVGKCDLDFREDKTDVIFIEVEE